MSNRQAAWRLLRLNADGHHYQMPRVLVAEDDAAIRGLLEVEEALKIAGPVRYPWGPPRGHTYRPHKVNAAGLVLARGCSRMGIDWVPAPLATLSAPRGEAHPCVYRGFCIIGCSTNAKQSVLVTWIPRAVRAGAFEHWCLGDLR